MKTLIEATTAADDALIFIPDDKFVSIAQSGLAAAEVISFEIDLDGTWTAIVPAIELTATENYIQIAGPNTYRVVKGVTASPTTVYVED